MKETVKRVALAFATLLVAFALAPFGHAQQADEDPAPATPQQQKPQAVPPNGGKQESSNPTQQESNKSEANEAQTRDALAFTGRIIERDGQLVLNDPVTKLNYQLDDPSKAKPFVGKQVKIIGKLGVKKNAIHIDSIGPAL